LYIWITSYSQVELFWKAKFSWSEELFFWSKSCTAVIFGSVYFWDVVKSSCCNFCVNHLSMNLEFRFSDSGFWILSMNLPPPLITLLCHSWQILPTLVSLLNMKSNKCWIECEGYSACWMKLNFIHESSLYRWFC